MSTPGPSSGAISQRQKRMGPAPFASFEDLSDEVRSRLDSPEDKNVAGSVVRLPGIREDATPTTPAYSGISIIGAMATPTVETTPSLPAPKLTVKPNTPRIDISRASSGSHHDSRDSTPERELFDCHSTKLGLGFKEDGTLDLRSSTEELDFQQKDEKRKGKTRAQSPSLHDDSYHNHQRKDSQCSDIVLLSISGRTSRLSSIGSQGSAQSRLSNASHLSVMSGVSRCSSPHKMVLETSFCGVKPPETAQPTQTEQQPEGTNVAETEDLEKILLARKHDPTQAILAEGISVEKIASPPKQEAPEKPLRRTETKSSVKSDITIKVDKPDSDSNNTTPTASTKPPKKKIVSKSGVEYIYIPLKGPLPMEAESIVTATKPKLRQVKSANFDSKKKPITEIKESSKSATPSPIIRKNRQDEPKYIRIKLKPDYMYSVDKDQPSSSSDMQKPNSLEIVEDAIITKADPGKSLSSTPSASPKLSRHTYITDTATTTTTESVTPSPSVSRRSSFASLFKSKEAIISPESPTQRKNTLTGIFRERSRSRSKSRDRDAKSSLSAAPSSTESIDSKSKHKSVLSLFKSTKKLCEKPESSPPQESLNIEFKFNESENVISKKTKQHNETSLGGVSVRIPLHSPTYYEDCNILQDYKTSSQDSQETVIEATCRSVNAIIEPVPKESNESNNTNVTNSKNVISNKHAGSRQSSTSSENVVFSTKLGNENEVFSTKLPKRKPMEKTVVEVQVAEMEMNGHEMESESTSVHIPEEAINPDKVLPHQDTSLFEDLVEKKRIRPELYQEVLRETRIADDFRSEAIKESEIPKDLPSKNIKEIEIPPEFVRKSRIAEEFQFQSEIKKEKRKSQASNADDEHNSSDSEVECASLKKKEIDLKLDLEVNEPERKGLVLQQDSFEDELPYIPTTLPLERSAAIPIVPIKQRSTFEMKTCPIERPRSTTPINPSCLEDYCEEVMGTFNIESVTKTIEKLKISLPRIDSMDGGSSSSKTLAKAKSPKKDWFEFAEKGITPTPALPPPLPPKGIQKNWINFEEIPEKRKAPKRIQTIPSRGHIDVPESVIYNYVNPEDCKCECHELNANKIVQSQEDELPLLDDDEEKNGLEGYDRNKLDVAVSDCRSIISDSSIDLSTSVEPVEANGIEAASLQTPFTSDLGITSNRSSIVSQDEPQSPGSPNAFPKIS